jgi:hypothetical protein
MKIIRDHVYRKTDLQIFWDSKPLGLPFTIGEATKVASMAVVVYGTHRFLKYLFETPRIDSTIIAGLTEAMDGLEGGRL